ncbi:MAG: hypothetical protein HN576_14115 [Bacteriovoracaceae bacterium]|jgi:hypothetical protein|nr:hypothetical protein [Bacteriovoracaceae bacterium]
MKTKLRYIIAVIVLIKATLAWSTPYYQTLPKNVRLIAVRHVLSSEITNFYEPTMNSGPLTIKANINTEALKSIQALDEFYFYKLKKYSPEAYDKFSAGIWSIDAKAKATVFGIGGAYGFTDRLTGFFALPYYDVKVSLKANRITGNNYDEVSDIIRSSGGSLRGLSLETNDLPDPTGELIQSVIVNYYGYQPGGDWEGKGYGDLELALKYRLTDWKDSGLAISGGAILPTGKVQNEDIIQDVGFGDGLVGIYGEFGGGKAFSSLFSINGWVRGQYRFPITVEKRIPENFDFILSANKGSFRFIPGVKIESSFSLGFQLTDWINIVPEYLYTYIQASEFKSPYTLANTILGYKSEEEKHVGKFNFEISSVNTYLKGNIPIPFTAIISVEKTLRGKNTADLTLGSLEFRLLF